jgi:hypothetical protein
MLANWNVLDGKAASEIGEGAGCWIRKGVGEEIEIFQHCIPMKDPEAGGEVLYWEFGDIRGQAVVAPVSYSTS